MSEIEIKIGEVESWADLITSLVITGLKVAVEDAKARGKDKLTLEELTELAISPNEDLLERLKKKAAGEDP